MFLNEVSMHGLQAWKELVTNLAASSFSWCQWFSSVSSAIQQKHTYLSPNIAFVTGLEDLAAVVTRSLVGIQVAELGALQQDMVPVLRMAEFDVTMHLLCTSYPL